MKKGDEYITIPRLAKILGISRIAVYKKVKKGQIRAVKIGRNFAIPERNIAAILGQELGENDRKEIDAAVRRAVREYGETLRLLGRE